MPTKSKIQDQTFLFTGTLTEFTRDEAEALVAAHGGKVLSGVSGKLNYLVVGEEAGNKLEKAKALGIVKILTEKEFLKMVPKGVSKSTSKAPGKKVAAKVAVKSAVKATSAKKDTSSADPIAEVKIGNQIWMAKNLDVTHFLNGDPIPEAKSQADWVKACKHRRPAWCKHEKYNNGYGNLYNWYAVCDSRGLAPNGFHVAGLDDWKLLGKNSGGMAKAGHQIKSPTGWETPRWGSKGNGPENSTFKALPSGYREETGEFGFQGPITYWWTSVEENSEDSNATYIKFGDDELNLVKLNKGCGLSVRCVKDIQITKAPSSDKGNQKSKNQTKPITVKFHLSGYGSEITAMELNSVQRKYWKGIYDDKDSDFLDILKKHVWEYESMEGYEKWHLNHWTECDSLLHETCAVYDHETKLIIEIFQGGKALEILDIPVTDERFHGSFRIAVPDEPKGKNKALLVCRTIDRGIYLEGSFNLSSYVEFELSKFKIDTIEVNNDEFIIGITYDGKPLSAFACADFNGKGFDVQMLFS